MRPSGGAWNEAGQSEDPAIALLVKVSFTYATPETLEEERESLRDVTKLNQSPWIGAALTRRALHTSTA